MTERTKHEKKRRIIGADCNTGSRGSVKLQTRRGTPKIRGGALQQAIIAGNEAKKKEIAAEIGALMSFRTALPGMIKPLQDELAEVLEKEKEASIIDQARLLKKLTDETLRKFEPLQKSLANFIANVEKLEDEFSDAKAKITGQARMGDGDQYYKNLSKKLFLGERVNVFGNFDFSTYHLQMIVDELNRYLPGLPERMAESFISGKTPGDRDLAARIREAVGI